MHKKSPPHAERSTNTFILTLQSDFVKHPPTILSSEAPADAPILANTNFSQDSSFFIRILIYGGVRKMTYFAKYTNQIFKSSF